MIRKTRSENGEDHFFLEQLETIFFQSLDMIGAGNLEGYFTKINPSFERILGYSEEELLAAPFLDFVCQEDLEKTKKALVAAASGQKEVFIENRYRCKDGSAKWIDWKVFSDVPNNLFVAVGRDITEQKFAKDALQQSHDELERRVTERTAQLQKNRDKLSELNVALKLLLTKRGEDKKELEEKVLINVEKLITPNLEKLKMSCNDKYQQTLLQIVQSNLDEITSPFRNIHQNDLAKLTPAQINIADLIRQGFTTKEIASHLKLSPSTIACHRQEIRKRLSLSKKKINLQTILATKS